MSTPDGRFHIVFNGEIYNYVELREELAALGYTFASKSDTEVLLKAYVHWGEDALNRLVGMFAFAVLDVRDRVLFLARDFFGIKPLYYTNSGTRFAFASEIAAMLELPGVSRGVHPQRLYEYLRFGITDHAGETLFSDIRQVPGGHYLKISLDKPGVAQPVRYWDIHIKVREPAELSFDEAAARIRALFLDSIRLHLRSDVPVGAALSGGVDSSSIVAAMRYLKPALDIHTFSYVANDSALSEEHWANLANDAAGATVHKVRSGLDDLVADLDELIKTQEQAFGSTSIYAQRRVFQSAREAGIKVMLDGQGADELLGGYHYCVAARLGSLLSRGRLAEAYRLFANASKLPGVGSLWLALRSGASLIPSRLQGPFRALTNERLNPSWMNAQWLDENGVTPRMPAYDELVLHNGSARNLLTRCLYDSLLHTSLPGLLRYEDRNSMAFSIESRVPYLTPALASFILSLPEQYIIAADGTTKAVFRKAMRGIVPDAILDRRDKIGFATPEHHWLLSVRAWVESVLTSEPAMRFKALNIARVQDQWRSMIEGRQPCDSRVWRWLSAILWTQTFGVTF